MISRSEPIQVREFEKIVGERIEADERTTPIGVKNFEDLFDFVVDFKPGANEDDVQELVTLGKVHKQKTITFKNYVGLIQTNSNLQVEILPKIKSADGEEKTKEVFIKMLCCLKDFPSKVFPNANINYARMPLFEIFIAMYVDEVSKLVKRGLKSAYINVEENLNVLKGKLIVKEQIRKNLAHKERFYVSYDEFLINRPENKLIKSTLLKLQKDTVRQDNAKEIRHLLSYFESVDISVNYNNDFSRVTIDRNTKAYETILKWSRVFLNNYSFANFSGDEQAKALLFRMEKVFEAYVYRNMNRVFGANNWKVTDQVDEKYLFDKGPGKFKLIPDIVVERPDDGSKVILDTKWKKLFNNKDKNYGISQSDMYQMFAYSKKWDVSEIWLLYPYCDEVKDIRETITYEETGGAKVSVFFVDVANIDKSLADLFDKLNFTRSKK